MLEKLFSITAYATPAAAPDAAAVQQTAEAVQQAAETAAAEPAAMTVFGFGFGLVFIGLIAIIIICKIMGWICQLFIKEDKAPKASKAPKAKKGSAPQKFEIPNKGEFVAAVSAVIAEELGKDASAIRILSIKKL